VRRWLPVLCFLALVPTAAHAAEERGIAHLVWEYFNLAVIVTVLIYFARKPVLGFFAERHDRIRDNLAASDKLLAEAKSRLAEWNERLARLDEEVARIRQISQESAELDRRLILSQAEATAERIRSSARAALDRELRHAREQLRAEAADLAVEVAGRLLREKVGDADRSRLVDEFITRVEREGAH
jgi:F-type H+-transporting ATPase subunit b